jgi:Fe-Mn family superoxide dismutase
MTPAASPVPRPSEPVKRQSPYEQQSYGFANVMDISRKTLDAHIELYKGYLTQTNAIFAMIAGAEAKAWADQVTRPRESLARRLAFEQNGVKLHELYFEQLDGDKRAQAPAAGSVATEAMDSAFGGFDKWRNDIRALGTTRGVGWVVSSWDPSVEQLANTWVDLHHLGVPAGSRIVYVVDLWEHAFWNDFGAAGRAKYVDSVLDNTDWSVVEERFGPVIT